LLAANGRSDRAGDFEIALGGAVESRADVRRWEDLGVTRMIVAPWKRSSEAIAGSGASPNSRSTEAA